MSMQGWMRVAVVVAAVLVGGAARACGQGTVPVTSGIPSRMPQGSAASDDIRMPKLSSASQEKMAIARNDERQRKLVADTDHLLALATELKAEVDKTDKFTLSLDVVKRTAEIEKLAKNIRERMKD